MIFTPLPLSGAYRIDLERREDTRGFFARAYCAVEFEQHGLCTSWVQSNVSLSRVAGTVRGMHFQRAPKAEAKLVRCIAGAVFDVIVDLRRGSPSYGQWTSVELTRDNRSMIYVPPCFAHGFQTLEPESELFYFHSMPYDGALEGGVSVLDRDLGIRWPLEIAELSPRDAALPSLAQVEPLAP